jgi:hypothetical protein
MRDDRKTRSALELAARLVTIADAMVDNSGVHVPDDTLRALRKEVAQSRTQLSETAFQIDYQASCLIECISEIATARIIGDRSREDRARMYIEKFRTFLRIDCDIAARKAVAS